MDNSRACPQPRSQHCFKVIHAQPNSPNEQCWWDMNFYGKVFSHCVYFLKSMAALPQYGVTNESMSASLRRLRKDRESSLCYRLKSIYYDSKFIKRCIHALGATGIPVFANLRNGLWYRESFDGSAYFKSTDGHSHHWNFSFALSFPSHSVPSSSCRSF